MNRKIRLVEHNRARIEVWLEYANHGACLPTTINTMDDVMAQVDRAERMLAQLGITGRDRIGATVTCLSGDPVWKKYKQKRIATRVVIEKVANGWVLAEAERDYIRQDGGYWNLELSQEQDEIAVRYLRSFYTIKECKS